jgi:hypothetical protein
MASIRHAMERSATDVDGIDRSSAKRFQVRARPIIDRTPSGAREFVFMCTL